MQSYLRFGNLLQTKPLKQAEEEEAAAGQQPQKPKSEAATAWLKSKQAPKLPALPEAEWHPLSRTRRKVTNET